jgi:hypothetical protein
MSESINAIFRKALENQGVQLTQKQVSEVLREVERRGVPIDWNTWYHGAGTGQCNPGLTSPAVAPR